MTKLTANFRDLANASKNSVRVSHKKDETTRAVWNTCRLL
jgi:hypothetical protein